MTAIWKYPIDALGVQTIEMPYGARILSVQTQPEVNEHGSFDRPTLWAVVGEDMPKAKRTIHTYGTGHPIPTLDEADLSYIGTYQLSGGRLVFHVFEEVPEK